MCNGRGGGLLCLDWSEAEHDGDKHTARAGVMSSGVVMETRPPARLRVFAAAGG